MSTFFDIHTHLFSENYVLRELLSGKTANFIGKLSNNFKTTSELAYQDLKQKYIRAGIPYRDIKLIVLTYDLDYIFQEKYDSLQNAHPKMQLNKAKNPKEHDFFTSINKSLAKKPKYADFLKENETVKNAHPNNVYLFYYFDPRRKGSLDFVKNNVRKKGESIDAKKYIGIKIYPQNGYSPLDPKMLELYEYCQKHDIPITVHFSNAGFSSFANKLEVKGDIMINGVLKKVDYPAENKSYFHTFKTKMLEQNGHIIINNIIKGIKERARTLNHPFLWHLVLEKYKNLRINFAHFGSGSKKRTNWVLEFIKNYDNAYTDLSCAKKKQIKRFLKKVKKHNLEHKILYGSDYALNELFTLKSQYIYSKLKKTFKDKYNKIIFENATNFLRIDENTDKVKKQQQIIS